MTKYRGYYIDNVIFNSKSDIDAFVKKQAVEAYIQACRWFINHPTMENSILCNERADRLHTQFGFSYEELEDMETALYR